MELAARGFPAGPPHDDDAHAPTARHQVDRRLGQREHGRGEPERVVGERDLGAGGRSRGWAERLVQQLARGLVDPLELTVANPELHVAVLQVSKSAGNMGIGRPRVLRQGAGFEPDVRWRHP